MLLEKMRILLRDDSGVAMVLMAMGLVVFLGCMSLVIDAGMLYAEHSKASNAVDAAVLAGARELPDDPVNAKAVALSYAQQNGLEVADVTFTISDDHKSISGKVEKDMNMFFARIFGIDTSNIGATAKARIGSVGGFSGGDGVIPIGVCWDADWEPNTSLILKYGGGDGTTGWFGFVDIDGQQTKVIADGIEYGSDTPVAVTKPDEDGLPVVTGVINAKQIKDAVAYRRDYSCTHTTVQECIDAMCPHIVFVPVGEDTGDSGSTNTFRVTGFAAFYLEPLQEGDDSQAIRGRYVKMVSPGYVDDNATDYGVYAVELCE